MPLLRRKSNKQKEECGEYSGIMASRWPFECSLCVTQFPHSPPLPKHSLARGCQEPFQLLLNPYSHTHHGVTSLSPCHSGDGGRRINSKPILATKELFQKLTLILFAECCPFQQHTSLPSTKASRAFVYLHLNYSAIVS